MDQEKLKIMSINKGFIAALDQSEGSTPKALKSYGIEETDYRNEKEMFDLVHAMRSRIIQSPMFTSEQILGTILYEGTMERKINGILAVDYLWNQKGIVSFLKVDQGLDSEKDGVQLLKPIIDLNSTLLKASKYHIFGTKERSLIKLANPVGIKKIVEQQFELAKQIFSYGLIPIIEPEVDINSPEKESAEIILKQEIGYQLSKLDSHIKVILKLSIPTTDNFYENLINHPNVIRIVALSGGYSQEEATKLLKRNHGLIASFSRALVEELNIKQSSEEFDKTLKKSIEHIYDASIT
ncbi:fructose bisphosphate aldolase [Lactococcus lactis]|uniref:fructose-bisphosphate aldolase n=1 Tax=Lactococcus lactis subsp. lactis TaxID=1360 RepID=A0A0V8E131_LACLL|nr:fructose bisphosphate aldolase [Lactococcus lactis]KSU19290.1 Fructose-bisphosphate aldolase class I [Lactococcus lactis subsp. lactis]